MACAVETGIVCYIKNCDFAVNATDFIHFFLLIVLRALHP
jgi:hypothetical protein